MAGDKGGRHPRIVHSVCSLDLPRFPISPELSNLADISRGGVDSIAQIAVASQSQTIRFSRDELKARVLCRTYGAQSVAVLSPGLPAWAISGAGAPGLDSDTASPCSFHSQLAADESAALNDNSLGPAFRSNPSTHAGLPHHAPLRRPHHR